jgi:Protein of unknown function (DUF3500)
MKIRRFTAIAGLLVSATVSAQDAARPEVTQEMVEVASALLATVANGPGGTETLLGFDRGKNLALELDDAAREDWTYWPTERVGVPLDLMTGEQRLLTHKLLSSVLSSNGYLKVAHIMQLEQILAMLDSAGLPRAVGHYKLVFFGKPSTDAPWAWRFEGHHVSLNVTVAPDGIATTPTFFGANPAEVRSGPLTGFRVLGAPEDLGRELVTSLSEAQRARAIISTQAPADIFTGNIRIRNDRARWNAWKETLQPQGIAVSDLNEAQQRWVRRILEEVVASYRPELSSEYLRSIDPKSLTFAWAGAIERGQPHYFRLQNRDFVFEYDNVQDNGNHVHSVWRSKAEDFGAELLPEHYRTSHVRPD